MVCITVSLNSWLCDYLNHSRINACPSIKILIIKPHSKNIYKLVSLFFYYFLILKGLPFYKAKFCVISLESYSLKIQITVSKCISNMLIYILLKGSFKGYLFEQSSLKHNRPDVRKNFLNPK